MADAQDWYEARAEGLGREFLRAVDACISQIERFPEGSQTVVGSVRRAMLRRFPYAIFYVVRGDAVVVFGCFHGSRNPSSWTERVRDIGFSA